MGVTWARGSKAGFQNFPVKLVELLRQRGIKAMEEVMVQAVADMRRFTESRPSAKSGKSGRVETGEMLESIAGKAFMEGADRIVGEFGFLDRKDLYFSLQTSTGFQHYRSGAYIEPTFAMRDAQVMAIQNLLNRLGA